MNTVIVLLSLKTISTIELHFVHCTFGIYIYLIYFSKTGFLVLVSAAIIVHSKLIQSIFLNKIGDSIRLLVIISKKKLPEYFNATFDSLKPINLYLANHNN